MKGMNPKNFFSKSGRSSPEHALIPQKGSGSFGPLDDASAPAHFTTIDDDTDRMDTLNLDKPRSDANGAANNSHGANGSHSPPSSHASQSPSNSNSNSKSKSVRNTGSLDSSDEDEDMRSKPSKTSKSSKMSKMSKMSKKSKISKIGLMGSQSHAYSQIPRKDGSGLSLDDEDNLLGLDSVQTPQRQKSDSSASMGSGASLGSGLNENGLMSVDGQVMSPNPPDMQDLAEEKDQTLMAAATHSMRSQREELIGFGDAVGLGMNPNYTHSKHKHIHTPRKVKKHLEGAIEINVQDDEKMKHTHQTDAKGQQQQQHQQQQQVLQIGEKQDSTKALFKCISWNLWCIPIGAPRSLSNPERCGNYLREMAIEQNWDEFDGLIFCAIQELWGWKTGIFPPFVLRIIALFEYIPYIGRVISAIFQFASLLVGILPLLKCLPIKYDPKQRFYNRVKKWLPHALCKTSIPVKNIIDSGLLLLSNVPPKKWGFESFEDCTCDDSMADKGFLYAYFESEKLMVINTHLQAAGQGRERIEQLRQLRRFLDHWRKRAKFDRICILGDFNSDMSSHQERMRIWLEQQQSIRLERSEEEDDMIEQERKKSENVGNISHNNDFVTEVPKSGVKVDIGKIDVRRASSVTLDEVELQMSDDHGMYGQQDPLSMMSYEDLPKDLVPIEARPMTNGQKGGRKLIKKGYINIPYHLGPKFIKINTYEYTYKRARFNIDHIFVNFEVEVLNNSLHAIKNGMLSDHKLVCTEFKKILKNVKSNSSSSSSSKSDKKTNEKKSQMRRVDAISIN